MISSVQRFLLFATIFLGISQFGKHFWPYFAYVSGIRVDYLSPTLYLSDILIIILALISLPDGFSYLIKKKGYIPLPLLMLVGTLCFGIITAKYAVPALYAAAKVVEMSFLGYMIAHHVRLKDFNLISKMLSAAVLVEGILVLFQMLNQSSVGGIWYYLGERTFSSASIGISTVTIFGHDILRSYGSFPHPNVLAFFAVISGTFIALSYNSARERKIKIFYLVLLFISTLILLSTFSRIGLLVFFGQLIILMIKKLISPVIGSVLIFMITMFALVFVQRFGISVLYSEDFSSRLDLAKIALDIISQNVLFGVGLNNFYYYQIDYQREISPVLLQPPHNIFLLIWLHTGIIGLVGSLYFIAKTAFRSRSMLMQAISNLSITVSLLFLSIVVIGTSDHYFLTLQQGMIMAAFVIGLMWIPENTKDLV